MGALSGVGHEPRKGRDMQRVMNLILDDEEVLELMRILLDDDERAALVWLRTHLSGKAQHVLEDRSRPDGRHP